MNTDPFFAWYSEIETPSEDCLFLNLFTPGLGAGNRPVMVWIHGGGWTAFAGTAPGFDGTALARREDIVVVSINHRLGVFGHLSLEGTAEDFADSGNTGVLDIVLALRWVRDNAEAFGGNPANVTVFGESGGASKIAALLSMGKAKGLFHRAIVQSSGSGMTLATVDEAASAASRLKQVLGHQRLDPLAMQALSMEEILKATSIATGPFRGMIDGRNFLRHPFDGTAPASAIDVPVMFGCTMTEGTYYMRGDPRNFVLEIGDVRRRLSRFLEIDGSATDRIIDIYRSEYPDISPSRLLFLCFSDYIFKRATYRMAELQSMSARAPVFAFHFEWETPIEGGRMGSPHTSEVPFIFGTTAAARACVGEGSDLPVMTQTMMAAWAAFARSGNPSHGGTPAWLPYTASQKLTMRLNTRSVLASDPGGVARAALADLPPFGYGHSLPAIIAD
jgi:para-nitrobenzyl esterase